LCLSIEDQRYHQPRLDQRGPFFVEHLLHAFFFPVVVDGGEQAHGNNQNKAHADDDPGRDDRPVGGEFCLDHIGNLMFKREQVSKKYTLSMCKCLIYIQQEACRQGGQAKKYLSLLDKAFYFNMLSYLFCSGMMLVLKG